MTEDRRTIYQQDCESFRYQAILFWSRFQTLIVIAFAALGVLLTKIIIGVPGIILAFGNFILVGLISLLSLKDRDDSKNFINRVSEYEKENKASPIMPKSILGVNSLSFTVAVSVLLALLNIFIIVFTFGAIK